MSESDKQIIKRLTKERDDALHAQAFWRAAFNRWCGKSTWPVNKNGKVEYDGVEFHVPEPFGKPTVMADGTKAYVIESTEPKTKALRPVKSRKTVIEDAAADSPTGAEAVEDLKKALKAE
jgi:hypothetical protein